MNIKQDFLVPNKFSRPQTKLRNVRSIAVHYMGCPRSTARNCHDYFNNLRFQNSSTSNPRYASSHFCVGFGEGEVIQNIPLDEWSYCTNQANSYSISIETSHMDDSGKFTQTTEQTLIELVAYLCKQYDLDPLTDVIRHYDVTRKLCPLFYVSNSNVWVAFKEAVKAEMNGESYNLPSYGTTISSPSFVSPPPIPSIKTKIGEATTTSNLNMRSGASTNNSIITTIPNDTTIMVNEILDNGWSVVEYNGQIGYCSSDYLDFSINTIVGTDTTGTVTIAPTGYQFALYSPKGERPYTVIGNGDVFDLNYVKEEYNYFYYQLIPKGNVGDETGIYTAVKGEETVKRFVAVVG